MFTPIVKFAIVLAFVSCLALVAVPSNAAPINATLLSRANTGEGTFYAPGLGACGITNTATDMIAAMAYATFDSYPGATGNPNDNPICNKKVTANYEGKSVTVTITDRCAGCAGEFDLDFSPSAFDQLADQSVGRLYGMTWDYA